MTAALLSACALAACTYVPPPAILSSVPENGAAIEDRSPTLAVTFTRPVARGTLAAALYPWEIDGAGFLKPVCGQGGAGGCINPVAGPCTPAACDGAVMVLGGDFTGFTFTPARPLELGSYVLRIPAGLSDGDGHDTGAPLDLMFSIKPGATEAATTFEPGLFMTLMTLEQPFAFPLETYWDVHVDRATGAVTKSAGCDSDPQDEHQPWTFDAPKTWFPTPHQDDGYKFIFTGWVRDTGGGTWYLETHPFEIYCEQPEVLVKNGWIGATVAWDPVRGRDVMTGTINSDETTILGAPPVKAFGRLEGIRLRPDEIGAAGTAEAWETCLSLDDATVTKKR